MAEIAEGVEGLAVEEGGRLSQLTHTASQGPGHWLCQGSLGTLLRNLVQTKTPQPL